MEIIMLLDVSSLLLTLFPLLCYKNREQFLQVTPNMHFILTCFFLPMINALVTVQIYRDSYYQPHSPCTFIRNTSLPNDSSIQSCIWECDYEYDCQTAVYFHDKKICSTFIELCETSSIQPSVSVKSSVICYRKNHGECIRCYDIEENCFPRTEQYMFVYFDSRHRCDNECCAK
jgi:hypothetical protein